MLSGIALTTKFNIKDKEHNQNSEKEQHVACRCLDKFLVSYN